MAKPTKGEIREQIDALRAFIDEPNSDGMAKRIAYAIETTLRWSIEDTAEWPGRVQDAEETAHLIRQDLSDDQ